MKNIILFFCTFLFLNCCQSRRGTVAPMPDVPIADIDNLELKTSIAEYQKAIYQDCSLRVQKGDSVYVVACAKEINDSISRYILFPILYSSNLINEMPCFYSKVDGHIVFITAASLHPNYFLKKSHFSYSDDIRSQLIQKFFPNETKHKSNIKKRIHYEPRNCYLTFKYDTLIGKIYQHGDWIDKVPVILDGKQVMM